MGTETIHTRFGGFEFRNGHPTAAAVEFDAGVAADDHDHPISPEERLRVAMAER